MKKVIMWVGMALVVVILVAAVSGPDLLNGMVETFIDFANGPAEAKPTIDWFQ